VHRDAAFLVSLANDGHRPPDQVDAGPIEAAELGDAQAGRVEQLEDRVVAEGDRGGQRVVGVGRAGAIEQAVDVGRAEHLRQPATPGRRRESLGGVRVDEAGLAAPAEVGPERGGLPGDARPGVPAGPEVGEVAPEQQPFDAGRSGTVGSGGPVDERRDVRPVRLGGRRRPGSQPAAEPVHPPRIVADDHSPKVLASRGAGGAPASPYSGQRPQVAEGRTAIYRELLHGNVTDEG
jgi:hypothetical protein